MTKAYIGLGANIGQPKQQVNSAYKLLSQIEGVKASRCSSLYVTQPVGYAQQPDFINAVAELTVLSSLTVEKLFQAMQEIENEMGRLRNPDNRNAPRLIDCDLLVYGGLELNTPTLTLPHPRIAERLFVLRPLVELNPDVQIGQQGYAQQLLEAGSFDNQGIERIV